MSSGTTPSEVSGKVMSRGCGSLFFLVFLGFGLLATVLLARSTWQNAVTYRWVQVPCEILESAVAPVANRGGEVSLQLRYRYHYANADFTSTQYQRGMASPSDPVVVYRLAEQLTRGTRSIAFVDPQNPSEAVLHRSPPWSALAVLFPLIFVGVGAGGIYFLWRRTATVPASSQGSSSPASGLKSRLGLGLFFTVFLLFGVGLGIPFFIRPATKILAARSWKEVPCEIVRSQVREHSGDKGSTYSVEVVYHYVINGRTYTAARYQFMSGSSSGYDGKAAIVAQLQPGSRTVCFVNPADPTDVVLQRGFTPALWFGLIPFIFALVGLGGIVSAIRGSGGVSRATVLRAGLAEQPEWLNLPPENAAGELTPTNSRRSKLLAILIFALFWNGIVSVFLWQLVADWRRGNHPWGLALFLIPFVAIGLGVIGFAVREGLAIFNPKPRLRVSTTAIPLGGSVQVTWNVEGRIEQLRRLHIFLEGREEATYRRGTRTRVDREVFRTVELMETADRDTMRSGVARLAIPADTMHSFHGLHNRVIWTLRVQGEIPNWPDIDDEFALAVLPRTRATT